MVKGNGNDFAQSTNLQQDEPNQDMMGIISNGVLNCQSGTDPQVATTLMETGEVGEGLILLEDANSVYEEALSLIGNVNDILKFPMNNNNRFVARKSISRKTEIDMSDDESKNSSHSEVDNFRESNDEKAGDSDEDYVPMHPSDDSLSEEDNSMECELEGRRRRRNKRNQVKSISVANQKANDDRESFVEGLGEQRDDNNGIQVECDANEEVLEEPALRGERK